AHVDPDILIVDEVLSVGDFLFQRRCMERVNEALSRGTAIIFVSHNLNAIASFCTRAMLLDHGRIPLEGSPQQGINAYMESGRTAPRDGRSKPLVVSHVAMRDRYGPRTTFRAGEEVWIDVGVTANRRCEDVSLGCFLKNRQDIEVFHTSTIRLGVA